MKKQALIIFFVTLTLMLSGCGTANVNETSTNVENDNAETTENNDGENSINDAISENKANEEDETVENNSNSEPVEESNNEQHTDEAENEAKDSGSLQELQVHYIDVGQADATLLQYADGEDVYTLLFDTGDWRRNDVLNYLANQNISTIDLIVTSHPHADHIGQLAEIVNTYDVGEVWMSGNEASSNTYIEAAEAVLNSDADYHEPRTGEEFSIGPLDITVLYPSSVTGDLNEESVSLRMTYGDVVFVFTGDAEKGAEAAMVQSGMTLDADILQLGHHGSKTSSTSSFIEAVNPDVAIYSAAIDSQYGHPDAEVVDRVQQAGIDLYGTDVHGTVIVTTDGQTYDITTKEDGTVSPGSTGSSSSSSSGQGKTENKPKKEDTPPSEPEPKPEPTGDCIDINSASIEDVQEIIHIGPARAEDLVNLRPFSSVNDLKRISGIGPARIDDINAQGKACVN